MTVLGGEMLNAHAVSCTHTQNKKDRFQTLGALDDKTHVGLCTRLI